MRLHRCRSLPPFWSLSQNLADYPRTKTRPLWPRDSSINPPRGGSPRRQRGPSTADPARATRGGPRRRSRSHPLRAGGRVDDEVVGRIPGERRSLWRIRKHVGRRPEPFDVEFRRLDADPPPQSRPLDQDRLHLGQEPLTDDQPERRGREPSLDDPMGRTRAMAAEISTLESSTARTRGAQLPERRRRRRISSTCSVATWSASSSVSPVSTVSSRTARTSRV